ncbi:MAG TPA: radical SAM protein [Nodularia sp. (in: cyanobacteria)]|nr:radical SAM protein [Nodularia sp. (in: cyanobacteria)]
MSNHSTLQRSRYNYFVDREEGVIAYNARTGTFALLAEDVAAVLRGKEPITQLRNTKNLVDMGFLHFDNEVEQVLSKFDSLKNQNSLLHLTLVPTLACNFSCDYCFQTEYRNARFMSPEIQEATLSYVESLIASGRNEVVCTWFGGEPLLAKDIVLNMSQKLCSAIDTLGARRLHMDIITNGILLNLETAKELAAVGIKSAQVSFDALVFKNTKKRGIIDSSGNPSIILRNIKLARDYLNIKVRLNVSAENMHEVPQIIDLLKEHGFAGSYGLARVHNHENEYEFTTDSLGKRITSCGEGGCGSCGSSEPPKDLSSKTLSRSDYARFEWESFLSQPESFQEIVKKLQPKAHFCSATSGRMFVIDPAGYVSRCWHSAGSPSESIDSVLASHTSMKNSDVEQRWKDFSLLAYPACRNCKVLPLCMGGCSHPRIFTESPKPPCESIKNQIQTSVDTIGKIIEIKPEQKELVSTGC